MKEVNNRIEAACARSGRSSSEVNIIAVTKYVSVEATQEVLDQGLLQIGENRAQNALPKIEALGDKAIWHYIGHLQSNKVKDVVGKFTYIHSVDRLSLAKEINKKAEAMNVQVNVFVQVNVSGEASKQGVQPSEAKSLLTEIKKLPHLKVIGLMTMAPIVDKPEQTRPIFRGLRLLRDELNQAQVTAEPMTELSMGMSDDFEIAIEEGATWVRLGTILVGKGETM
jgi:pyridoxal phosphate enzyme (YggS family)